MVADDKKLVRFNEEALILADPDAYLTQKGPMNPDPQPLSERAHYRDLRAVRTDGYLWWMRTVSPGPAPAPWRRRRSWSAGSILRHDVLLPAGRCRTALFIPPMDQKSPLRCRKSLFSSPAGKNFLSCRAEYYI